MKENFYILGNGNLKAEEKVLRFDSKDGMRRIPVENIRSINFYDGGNLTTGALSLGSKYNIIFNFFGYYGNYIGSYWPKETYFSGDLTIQQAKLFLDSKKRLELCNILVNGIKSNMKYFLEKSHIDTNLLDIDLQGDTVEHLMLSEARMRKQYYKYFDQLLPDEFKIEERIKHPPNNFGNTLISFGNSRLYAELVTQCRYVSLNPTISFYHSPESSRYSLPLDVSEVFKPYLVDRFILKILKKQIIKPTDFHKEGNGILLSENGRKKFLQEWERWLNEAYFYDKLKRHVSNRELLKIELYKLTKHFMDIEVYKYFMPWRR